MDRDQFDALTRHLAFGASRRALLARLTAGVLVAPTLALGDDDVQAKQCPPCRRKKKGRCRRRAPNGTRCERARGVCQDGVCGCAGGPTCAPHEACQAGFCFPRGACAQGVQACVPESGTKCGDDCFCVTSAEDVTVCVASVGLCGEFSESCFSNPSKATCSNCQTSADCLLNQACIDVSGCCNAIGLPGPLPTGTTVCASPCPEPDA